MTEASVAGFGMITPYESVTGGDPRFLHFYELDTHDAEGAFRSMTPRVVRLIGERGSEGFRAVASGPGLRIVYVNTFQRVGVAARAG